MKVRYLLILSLLILTSCATIINSPDTKVRFFSREGTIPFILNNDSAHIYHTDTVVRIQRSKEPLRVSIVGDSLPKTRYTVDSQLSSSYAIGNLFTYFAGYLIDLTNPKMYTYPGNIEISENSLSSFALTDYRLRKPTQVLTPDHSTPNPGFVTIKKRGPRMPGRLNLQYHPLGMASFDWQTYRGRDHDNWAITTALGINYYLSPGRRLSLQGEAMLHSTSTCFGCGCEEESGNNAEVLLAKLQVGRPVYNNLWVDVGIQYNYSEYADYEYFPVYFHPLGYQVGKGCYHRYESK